MLDIAIHKQEMLDNAYTELFALAVPNEYINTSSEIFYSDLELQPVNISDFDF